MFKIKEFFEFEKNNTDLRTEVIAGFTTFATMAYLIAVVPGMLSKGGLPFSAAMTVTIVMTVLTTLAMAFYTNRPFVLFPGLGSVAIFSFILLGDGVPLSIASGIVFISGAIFMAVSFLGIRDFIVRVIPHSIKVSVGVGIGLFIALLGLKQAGIVIANPSKNVLNLGDLSSAKALMSMLGFFLVMFFVAQKTRGGIILAILITTAISIPFGLVKVPDSLFAMPGSMEGMLFQIDIIGALDPKYLPFLLAFFIPDFFSTLGTLLGVGSQAGYLDKDGNLPGIEKNFHVDSCATTFGSLFSCPVLTTYLESSAGVEAGGRTGFTAVVTAILFLFILFILFLSPLATMIPTVAIAPVLIYIGFSMMSSMKKVNYEDITEYFPAFICVAMTIFSFNSGNGIAAAMVVYAFLKIVTGRMKEDHWSVYVIALAMIYYFSVVASH